MTPYRAALVSALLQGILAGGAAAQRPDDAADQGGRLLRTRVVAIPRVEMGVFREITTLGGVRYAGKVYWVGRNAIQVRGQGFEVTLPLAALCERDFEVYGFQESRESDGRFWHERKAALENERGGLARSEDDIESLLAGLAPVAGLIEGYERRLETLDPTVPELERFVCRVHAAAGFTPFQWPAVQMLVGDFQSAAEVLGSPEARRNSDQSGKLEALAQSAKEKILALLTPSQRSLWEARAPKTDSR